MTNNSTPRPLGELYDKMLAGQIDRRQFFARATALGLSATAVSSILSLSPAFAQATPEATPTAANTVPYDFGTDGKTRGQDGDLRILVPQAASALSVHNATGGKDIAAGSIISEPLLAYGAGGELVPILAAEVPTVENGGLAADLSSATFKLKEGVLWSDGTPFTADDVVFTWQWNVDGANQSIDQVSWELVSGVEAIDPLTAKVTFAQPTLGWAQPFGSNIGVIYPKHFWDGKDALEANTAFAMAPIGTGAFALESFAANDQVVYAANPNYREPNKPVFARIILKGGGDPASAIRAVTETGDWDLAFTLQIDPEGIEASLGDLGTIQGPPGTGVEKIQLNFSDPNQDVTTTTAAENVVVGEGTPTPIPAEEQTFTERSQKDTPHPFWTDKAVRQAFAYALDRQTIADRLYGGAPSNPPGVNILTGQAEYESPNTTWEYNLDKANQTLDEAGWVLDGDVRKKDGVELSVKYVTTTAPVRGKVQQVVKADLEKVGFKVEILQVDGSVFFDGAPGNDQNFTHFYSDMQEYTDGSTSAFPINYMKYWYAGPGGENIAQASNAYTGTNKTRYQNPEYDAAYEQLAGVTDAAEAAALFIQLNDVVINEVVEVPLVHLVSDLYAASNRLTKETIIASPFGDLYWNIANWSLAE